MRNKIFRTIAVFVVIAVFSITLSMKVDGYDMYNYSSYNSLNNVRLTQNKNQVFIVGTNGKDVNIDSIFPDNYSVNLSLGHNVYSYELFSDKFIFICPDRSSNQTEIVLYDIYDDTITSFCISGLNSYESSQIAYSDGYVFLADDFGNVNQYSTNGKLLNTQEIYSDRCHLMCDYYGTLYCYTSNRIFELYGETFYEICNCSIDAPARFISDNTFIDDTGYIYTIGNTTEKFISKLSTVTYPSGGIHNNSVVIADYDTIYTVDSDSDKITRYIDLNRQIEMLCAVGDNIFAFNYHDGFPTVSHIKFSNLNSYTTGTNVIDKPDDIDYYISSDTYNIDHKKCWITDIAPQTTVAQFKRNMNYDGFDVSFVRFDGKVLKSGKIGTATVVTFYNDEISFRYELSVKGDLTGEGNMNTRDKSMLFDYLLEEVIPTGVYVDAADLDYSNSVDIVDLVILTSEVENIDL
ncbi:MAG: hypothetical protein IJ331_01385 [Ruminococcus sp.]|nr:hypothetical protein [Ruminococcus sp.]